MAIPLTINGATFEYPENFDENWGVNATGWAQAVTNGMLQLSGGNFPITADINFGPNFGLLSKYFETRSALPATTGTVRLSSADAGIAFRNNANNGNLILTTNAADTLLFNGVAIGSSGVVSAGTAGQVAYYAASSSTVSGTNAFTIGATGPNGIITGTNTNNNAAAGKVGEYVSSTATANFPTSTQFGDLTSISLTAGDWDVSAIMTAVWVAGTVNAPGVGISSTTGNSGTGLNEGDNFAPGMGPTSTDSEITLSVPVFRISLSGTTTYYLKYRATYNSTVPVAAGRISARRVR